MFGYLNIYKFYMTHYRIRDFHIPKNIFNIFILPDSLEIPKRKVFGVTYFNWDVHLQIFYIDMYIFKKYKLCAILNIMIQEYLWYYKFTSCCWLLCYDYFIYFVCSKLDNQEMVLMTVYTLSAKQLIFFSLILLSLLFKLH